tara:strand:+ start:11 stop:526 length:516 start_codon:yes stop_codon:yes gene_type:complete
MKLKIIVPFGNPKRNFDMGEELEDKELGKELFRSLLKSEMAEPVCDKAKTLTKELLKEKSEEDKKKQAEKADLKAGKLKPVVEGDLAGLKAEIKAAKAQLASVKKDNEKLSGDLSTLKSSQGIAMGEKDAEIKNLTIKLAEARTEAASAAQDAKLSIEELKAEIEALKAVG